MALNYPLQNIANVGKEVYLFNRQKDGNLTIMTDRTFYPYFYEESKSGVFQTIDNKKVSKIICVQPSQVKQRRTDQSYEADVFFTKRYVIDKIGEVLLSPIKYLFIDIEIKTKELPSYLYPDKTITCISVYNSLSKSLQSWFIPPEKSNEALAYEELILKDFIKYIKLEQPDILLGWNFVNFDYPYLAARIKKLWNLDLAELISPIGKMRYGKKEQEDIPYPAGISIIDYLDMFKKIYRNEPSNALDDVAHKYLGTEKNKKFDFNQISEEIKEKNIEDVKKMVKLEEKLKIINYFDEIRRMSKAFWEDLVWHSRTLDMMLLTEAKSKGIILPSKKYREEIIVENEFEGAYRRADVGRFENLYKLDLSSAYPMAIIDFCLDIANLTDNKNEQKIEITDRETNEVKYPVYFKQNGNALLPTLARKLIIKKDYIKKQLKSLDPESVEGKDLQIKYDAIKALVNSLFGVTALKIFRLYNVNIASAITSIVRDLLHYVETKLQEQGIKVIYLDTDSVFIEAKENPLELCNQFIKDWAKEKYNKTKIGIEFDYEGIFEQILVVALCHYKGRLRKADGKLKTEIKGIEAKRKDSSKFMQEFQTELIERVLNKEEKPQIDKFIEESKQKIKTVPLQDIAFPCKIAADKKYKNEPIFIRALRYTTDILPDFKKVSGDLFYYVYVEPTTHEIKIGRRKQKDGTYKQVDIKKPKDVIAFDEDSQKHVTTVDWIKMTQRNIGSKFETIYAAMGWIDKVVEEEESNVE